MNNNNIAGNAQRFENVSFIGDRYTLLPNATLFKIDKCEAYEVNTDGFTKIIIKFAANEQLDNILNSRTQSLWISIPQKDKEDIYFHAICNFDFKLNDVTITLTDIKQNT